MDSNIRIAVILPVYKKDKVDYLSKAIESIVMQTYRDFHIYIGVDGPVGEDIERYFKMIESQSILPEWMRMIYQNNIDLKSRLHTSKSILG